MKFQKIRISAIALFLLGATGYLNFTLNAACSVKTNPIDNTGHCRIEPYGTAEICYTTGLGPACAGTILPD